MASLLELSGLGWSVPDFSTLSRRPKTLDGTIPYRGATRITLAHCDAVGRGIHAINSASPNYQIPSLARKIG